MFLRLMTYALSAAGFGAGLLVIPVWFWTRYLPLVLGFHLAAFFLVSAAALMRAKRTVRSKTRAMDLLVCAFVLFFPGIGALGGAVLTLWVWLFGTVFKQGVFEDYELYIQERDGGGVESHLRSDALRQFRSEVSFQPFIDILRGHDISTKAKVIEKLSHAFSRENVLLLKAAAKDEHPEVRLYAAGALIKLEAALNEKIQRSAKEAKRTDSVKAHADLGDLYRQYAESGMLDETLSNFYLMQSADAYRHSLDLDTDQAQVIEKYARCLLKLGKYPKARGFLDHALRLWPENEELIFLRNETYFYLRDFGEVTAGFGNGDFQDLDDQKRKVASFWQKTD